MQKDLKKRLKDIEKVNDYIKNHDTSFTIPLRHKKFTCYICNKEFSGIGYVLGPNKKEKTCCLICAKNL